MREVTTMWAEDRKLHCNCSEKDVTVGGRAAGVCRTLGRPGAKERRKGTKPTN
jgi:hypothetical protein